ncbi:MAG TPA: hypothetical protein VME45_03025 [Stellaceae bacterium]|nr:hypothetical protein [Stellaceae bacterium]
MPALNEASGEFPIGGGTEPYSDGRVPKVDPVADVPRSDLSRLGERFEARSELTDAKDSAGYGKNNFAVLWVNHHTNSPIVSQRGSGPFVPTQTGEHSG